MSPDTTDVGCEPKCCVRPCEAARCVGVVAPPLTGGVAKLAGTVLDLGEVTRPVATGELPLACRAAFV